MSASFTPGPWEAVRCGPNAPSRWNVQHRFERVGDEFQRIRTIDQVLDFGGAEEAEANASLIAAAPELLDCLENLVIGVGMGWDLDGIIEASNAAINKARALSPTPAIIRGEEQP